VRISDEWYGRTLSLPGIVFTFALVVVPVFCLFALSFLRYDFISPIRFVGVKNYVTIFSDRLLSHSLKITTIYTFGVSFISLIASTLIAYGLSTIGKRRFATLYRTLAILPFAVPLVLSGLIWRWLLDPAIGVMNYVLVTALPFSQPINVFGNSTAALFGVIIADAWVKIPFMTVFSLAGMDSISRELYDAAMVDGASVIQRFRHITWPLSRRWILYGLFITSMFSFRTIDAIWSMTRGGPGKATYHLGIYLLDKLLSLMHLGEASVVGIIVFFCIGVLAVAMLYLIQRSP